MFRKSGNILRSSFHSDVTADSEPITGRTGALETKKNNPSFRIPLKADVLNSPGLIFVYVILLTLTFTCVYNAS